MDAKREHRNDVGPNCLARWHVSQLVTQMLRVNSQPKTTLAKQYHLSNYTHGIPVYSDVQAPFTSLRSSPIPDVPALPATHTHNTRTTNELLFVLLLVLLYTCQQILKKKPCHFKLYDCKHHVH